MHRKTQTGPHCLRLLHGLAFLLASTLADASAPPGLLNYEVGTLPGKLAVDAGAAVYSIPLEMPPGVAGVKPELALVYNSRGPEGALGPGWGISGGSAISRCARNLSRDGVNAPIGWNREDRFCLDGQRLVAISGIYGADGTEYRTEVESYARIRSHGEQAGGPAFFTVESRSGETAWYGATADARLEPDGSGKVFSWARNRVADTLGNAIVFHYRKQVAPGAQLLERVTYGHNVSILLDTATFPEPVERYVAGKAVSVPWRYTGIRVLVGDAEVGHYRFGFDETAEGRPLLASVTRCAASSPTAACLPPVTFGWQRPSPDHWNGRRTAAGGVCKDGYPGCDDADNHGYLHYPDVNGDGFADLCFRGDHGVQCRLLDGKGGVVGEISTDICGSGVAATRFGRCDGHDNYASIRFPDIDSDGRADLFYRDDMGARVFLYDGTGFRLAWRGTLCANAAVGDPDWQCAGDREGNFANIHFADVDGDARVDLCFRGQDGIECLLGDGTGRWDACQAGVEAPGCVARLGPRHWRTRACASPASAYAGTCNSVNDNYLTIRFADLNGDGRSDLFYRDDLGVRVHHSTGHGMTASRHFAVCADGSADCAGQANYGSLQFADLEGNGTTDLCLRSPGGIVCYPGDGNGRWERRVATGICADAGSAYGGCGEPAQHNSIRYVDVDADGRTELVFRSRNGLRVMQWNGNGFDAEDETALCGIDTRFPKNYCYGVRPDAPLTWQDFNADGKPDLVFRSPLGIQMFIQTDFGPLLVTDFTDSLGISLHVDYAPSAAVAETADTAVAVLPAAFPAIDSPAAGYVVTQVGKADGLGGWQRTRYRYGPARVDLQGRGFMGFVWDEVIDESTGVATRTEYALQHPLAGTAVRTLSHLGGQVLSLAVKEPGVEVVPVEETVVLWEKQNKQQYRYGTARVDRYRVFAGTTLQDSYDPDSPGKRLSRVETREETHDEFGNVTRMVVVSSSAGETLTKLTTSRYANTVDEGRWHPGRLLASTVTHSKTGSPGETVVRSSAFEYDPASGLLVHEIVEPDVPAVRLSTRYVHDAYGNRTRASVSGLSGGVLRTRTTETGFGSADVMSQGKFATSVRNAMGHVERRDYDPRLGVMTRLTGPNGLVTTWQYDPWGRKTGEQRADGTRTVISREWVTESDPDAPDEAVYRVQERSDGQAPVSDYYDGLGRKVRRVTSGFDGRPVYQDTAYDAQGREVFGSLPYFRGDTAYGAQTLYDVFGRVTGTVVDTGHDRITTRKAYAGHVTIETNALGQQRETTTNVLGKVSEVREPGGARVSFEYDAIGNLLRTHQHDDVSGMLSTISVSYDVAGRKIAMSDPDMGDWRYRYDAFGKLVEQVDARGQVSRMTYDDLGRMVRRDEPEGHAEWVYDTAAHGVGKLHSVSQYDPSGQLLTREVHHYDALGRPGSTESWLDEHRFDTSVEYDVYGRVSRSLLPNGFEIRNRYNEQGYLLARQSPASEVADYDLAHLLSLRLKAAERARGALVRATELGLKARYFRDKAAEYEAYAAMDITDHVFSQATALDNPTGPTHLYPGQGVTPPPPDGPYRLYAKSPDDSAAITGNFLLESFADGQLFNLTYYAQPVTTCFKRCVTNPAGWRYRKSIYSLWFLLTYSGFDSTWQHVQVRDQDGDGRSDLVRLGQDASTRPFPASVLVALGESADILRVGTTTDYSIHSSQQHVGDYGLEVLYLSSPDGATRFELARVNGAWRVTPVSAQDWQGLQAAGLQSSADRLSVGDFDADGQTDAMRLEPGRANPVAALADDIRAELLLVADDARAAALALDAQTQSSLEVARGLVAVALDIDHRIRVAQAWADASAVEQLAAMDGTDGYITWWRANARDAAGRPVSERAGNGLVTVRDYDPATGQLNSIQSGFGFSELTRDLAYHYDAMSNVLSRIDHAQGVHENFSYDEMNRLVATVVDGTSGGVAYRTETTFTYDALGNMRSKSDVGSYFYGDATRSLPGNAGPHAVRRAANHDYHYDENGSVTAGGGRTVAWSSFNKPTMFRKDGNVVQFAYGPDRTRYRKTVGGDIGVDATTYYLGKAYERVESADGSVTHKYFVYADKQLVAIHIEHESAQGVIDETADETRYLHHDALGSVDTITDGRGAIVQRMGYAAFGARRAANWDRFSVVDPTLYTNRGFTGHEHIEEIGLIHMNGRVYDPEIGRFLSADPHVQAPFNTQSHNRYSYVLNNPLKYTDPSGYFFRALKRAVSGFMKRYGRMIVAMGLAYATGGLSAPLFGGVAFGITNLTLGVAIGAGAVGGFTSAFVMTGSLKAGLRGALVGGISAGVAHGIGQLGLSGIGDYAEVFRDGLHGVAQGLISEASGGDFVSGFVGASVGHFSGRMIMGRLGSIPGPEGVAVRTTVAAISGGAASALVGGKFENGALAAAFSHMFNNELSRYRHTLPVGADASMDPTVNAAVLEKVRARYEECGGQQFGCSSTWRFSKVLSVDEVGSYNAANEWTANFRSAVVGVASSAILSPLGPVGATAAGGFVSIYSGRVISSYFVPVVAGDIVATIHTTNDRGWFGTRATYSIDTIVIRQRRY